MAAWVTASVRVAARAARLDRLCCKPALPEQGEAYYGVKVWTITSWLAGVTPGLPRKSVQEA